MFGLVHAKAQAAVAEPQKPTPSGGPPTRRNSPLTTRGARSQERLARFGLKRGKLLYVFKYPQHDVERDKHRNVITRARFIKLQLEQHGYRLIPWDFKKGQPPRFWDHDQPMEEDDDDLYGPSDPQPDTKAADERPPKQEEDGDSSGDEPMEEDSGDDDDEDDDSDSVRPNQPPPPLADQQLTLRRTSRSS